MLLFFHLNNSAPSGPDSKLCFVQPRQSRESNLPEPAKSFRQLASIGEPHRAELNVLAAAVLEEWPDVALSALFSASRDADDLEAKPAFLALARRISPLRKERLAAIVGYERDHGRAPA
jgi:hypothetical protein